MNLTIRMAYSEDWEDAIGVAWKTFLEFEGNEYPEVGVTHFKDFLTDRMLYKMFLKGEYQMFVALDDSAQTHGRSRLIGLISLRNITHISLLFVDKEYHRRGVGRKLIETAQNYLLSELNKDRMTVNAAPYAVDFYHKLGFHDTGSEQMQDGIVFTPMELYL